MNNFPCREHIFCSLWSPGLQLRDLWMLLHIPHSKNHPATAVGGWLCTEWPSSFVMCCQRIQHWKTYEMTEGLIHLSSLLVEVRVWCGNLDQNQPWNKKFKLKGHNPISIKTNGKFLLTSRFGVLVPHNIARDCPSLQKFWKTSLATLKWCLHDVKKALTEITYGIRP